MSVLLEVTGLSKRFGGLQAVQDVSFQVEEGEIVGIIGPNGAGKTTVFNLLSGVYRPDSGHVRFRGEEITGLPPHEICRRGIGRTFQLTRPFARLTVRQTVTIGALNWASSVAEAARWADRVLEEVGLAPKRDALGGELTVADRKRLEFARALATRPRLLLLDEVVAGLTPAEVREMVALIQRIAQREKLSVLIVEHVLHAVMTLSRRVIVLYEGRKIAEGTPEALARDRRVVEAYLGEEYVFA